MKKTIIAFIAFSAISFTASADLIECRRVIEVNGRHHVFKPAPNIETRMPKIVINTTSRTITYTKLMERGQLVTRKVSYLVAMPNEEFETRSLVFQTDVGETILNSSNPERGRYSGSHIPRVIAEIYEGDIDNNAWTYLCPLRIKSILRIE